MTKQLDWNRSAVLKLAEMYEEHRLLYDASDPLYKNKYARYDALIVIANNFKDSFPDITPNDIKSKINSLRTQYATEYKKQLTQGYANDILPYWYSQMKFLNDHLKCSEGKTDFMEVTIVDDQATSAYFTEDDSYDAVTKVWPPKRTKVEKIKTTELPSTSEVAQRHSTSTVGTISTRNFKEPKYSNELETFGEYIKAEIGSICDPVRQATLRRRVINLIFDFKMEEYMRENDKS